MKFEVSLIASTWLHWGYCLSADVTSPTPSFDLASSVVSKHQDFERILKTHHASLMGDPFIKLYMDDILRTMRTQVLLKAIAPYTRVTLPHVASELNGIPISEVEDLLVSLILDGKLEGKIDQVRAVMSAAGDKIFFFFYAPPPPPPIKCVSNAMFLKSMTLRLSKKHGH